MSLFRSRRAVATLGLVAVLFLILPTPSQAAGLWETPVITRLWSWMESLGIVKPPTRSRKPTARWEKQGSAIDPDGRTIPGPPAPPASATSDQGSAIDPDGRN